MPGKPSRRRASPLIFGFFGFLLLAYGLLLPTCCSDEEIRCEVNGGTVLAMSIPIWIGTPLALAAFLASCCCGDNTQKKRLTSGCLYLLSCLVAAVPIIWFTYILRPGLSKTNKSVEAGTGRNRMDPIGTCLTLPWTSLVFLLIAGVLELRKKDEEPYDSTPPLEQEGEVERCGEDGVHF